MNRKIWALVLGMTLVCTGASQASEINLMSGIQLVRTHMQTQFNPASCEGFARTVYDRIFKSDPQTQFDLKTIRKDRHELANALFETRLLITQKLAQSLQERTVSEPCKVALIGLIRAARHIEDYLGMLVYPQLTPKDHPNYTGFMGATDFVQTAPRVRKALGRAFDPRKDLRNGDVIIVRSDGVVSSAVTRMGNVDSQFSHALMVYVDSETGKKYIVESILPNGVRIIPLEEHLSSPHHVRQIVLRAKNRELASQAINRWVSFVKGEFAKGKKVPYDFYLNDEDYSKVNCSEMVKAALDFGSDGKIVPGKYHSTSLSGLPTHFLTFIGAERTHAIFPGDLEFDPQFDILAEWRDYQRLNILHIGDVVNTKVFNWMSKYDYILYQDAISLWASQYIINLRDKLNGDRSVYAPGYRLIPGSLQETIKKMVSTDLTPTFLMHFIQLHRVIMYLEMRLRMEQEAFLKKSGGIYPTPNQLGKMLEQIRIYDRAEFINEEEDSFLHRVKLLLTGERFARWGAELGRRYQIFKEDAKALGSVIPFHRIFRPEGMKDPRFPNAEQL